MTELSNQEINERVHEEVMGLPPWTPFVRSEIEGEPCGEFLSHCRGRDSHIRYANETAREAHRNAQKPKPYAEDIAAAMQIRDVVRDWPFSKRLKFKVALKQIISKRLEVRDGTALDESEIIFYVAAKDICLAALAATGSDD